MGRDEEQREKVMKIGQKKKRKWNEVEKKE